MTVVTATSPRRVVTAPVVGIAALAVVAWVVLAVWGTSPYARYLDHGAIGQTGLAGAPLAAVVIGGWTLMVLAMMLPTTLPLVRMVGDVGASRGQQGRLTVALVVGYVSIWVAVGAVAWAGDSLLHVAEDRWLFFAAGAWLLAPASLGVAAVFQMSSLKDRCLSECRSPRGLLLSRWRGRQPVTEAWLLGVVHGRYCVGCCWALMLVMFAVGGGNLGIMLALGTVMAAEKNLPRGHLLTTPVAVLLGLAALGTFAAQLM